MEFETEMKTRDERAEASVTRVQRGRPAALDASVRKGGSPPPPPVALTALSPRRKYQGDIIGYYSEVSLAAECRMTEGRSLYTSPSLFPSSPSPLSLPSASPTSSPRYATPARVPDTKGHRLGARRTDGDGN